MNTHNDGTLLLTNYDTQSNYDAQSNFDTQAHDEQEEQNERESEIDDEDVISWPLLMEKISQSSEKKKKR
ncbi:unnamed protein product, partial [Rotaria sordida]